MRITMKYIAKLAGVSIATVSKVINGKTHDIGEETIANVKKIVAEHNYVPNYLAKAMKINRTFTLGLVIPDIRNTFFTDIARGAEDESASKGYTMFFCNSDDKLEKEIEYLNSLKDKMVDGVLIAGSNKRNISLEQTLKFGVPLVAIDRVVNYKEVISSVTTKNIAGAYSAVVFLIVNGHKNILYLGGPQNSKVSSERLQGYKKALVQNGYRVEVSNILFGEFTTQSGYDRIMKIEEINNYTAVFCANDMIALGAINALNKRSILVPNEMSVIGVDDIEFASFSQPSLTTVNQSAYELGRMSAKIMIDYLDNKDIKKINKLEQKLVVRNSVCNINRNK